MEIIFYLIAFLLLTSATLVVVLPNPVYSALSLGISMVMVAGLFFTLESYFLAGVQLIIYAGAVVVLFVMVLMILDVKNEQRPFSKGNFVSAIKISSAAIIFGCIVSGIYFSIKDIKLSDAGIDAMVATKGLALKLFTDHLISFELIGVLLLVVLVGALSLAKIGGGTNV